MDKVPATLTFEYLQLLVSIITAIATSSGIWLFFANRNKIKDSRDKLLMGLAHDRIMALGMVYLQRKWVIQDEYENLCFLYTPYAEMGGNGTAKKIMDEVNKLPIRKITFFEQEGENENVVEQRIKTCT